MVHISQEHISPSIFISIDVVLYSIAIVNYDYRRKIKNNEKKQQQQIIQSFIQQLFKIHLPESKQFFFYYKFYCKQIFH